MFKSTAAVIFDSGFSAEVLSKARHIAGYIDLISDFSIFGGPFLTADERAQITPSRAQDPFNHGTVILETFCNIAEDVPVYLGRVVSPTNNVLRTVWNQGKVIRSGWTEAHRLCVQHANKHNLQTVGSFSWGGFESAMDDTGWERFVLGQSVGAGLKGHAVIAAAGEGTPKSSGGNKCRHASWNLDGRNETVVRVFQSSTAEYNLWAKDRILNRSTDASRKWRLTITLDGRLVQEHQGIYLGDNLWNSKQNLGFAVVGRGHVEFRFALEGEGQTAFDCWIKDGAADVLDHHDRVEVIEPAIFSNVIAVGLDNADYSPEQGKPGCKPEIILADDEPHRMLSFHVPHVAIKAVSLMQQAELDCHELRALLQAAH